MVELIPYTCQDYFPKFKGVKQQVICFLYLDFSKFVENQLVKNSVHVAAFCILINIFHMIVLTQKSMRTSPIYILLLAIALIDICSLSYDVHTEVVNFFNVMKVCYSKETDYKILIINNAMDSIRSITRRCSTWLSLSIAVIRTIVIKYPMNPKIEFLSKPKTAVSIILFIFLLCSPIQLTDYFKYNIVPNDEDYKCTQYMTTEFRWYWNQVFTYYPNKKAYTYIKITESLLSKVSFIIPCVTFPIVTLILILEMRKINIQRQKLESSSETKKSKNTSKLVLCLTLPFFIAELPLGIVFWMSQSSIVLGEERFFVSLTIRAVELHYTLI
ncbi:hypothetical protein CRE_24407 [Caenorhabditis remanei]|uniref:G-protein coupled receptors family 1 profile domain-containing protein n=1 Tax=Caenorhabditis remanei TaxID=31234 RepID=E3MFU3_CAERE|nr:hypothetical protein CRE_24407 [Caenorhabditis remanei]